ncbi:hypothetical protein NPIL_10971 [Nephila pilipes]|uniref:Uncharacterized protein n=1 Tax=Nephila pilipes TaxID=299642 RepID=A0A8X6TVQ2_NEPPI|nr:hypothetical protein NPIL_10971 [Nephila pilipes]
MEPGYVSQELLLLTPNFTYSKNIPGFFSHNPCQDSRRAVARRKYEQAVNQYRYCSAVFFPVVSCIGKSFECLQIHAWISDNWKELIHFRTTISSLSSLGMTLS